MVASTLMEPGTGTKCEQIRASKDQLYTKEYADAADSVGEPAERDG